MVLCKKRITNTLIRLRGCAVWSAHVLFANPRRQVCSRPMRGNMWIKYTANKGSDQSKQTHRLICTFAVRWTPAQSAEPDQMPQNVESDQVLLCSLTEWEHSGTVVGCLARDRRAAGSSLIGLTVLCQDTFILA